MNSSASQFESRLVASPCCLPKLSASEIYPAYQKLGFSKFEAFSSWATCRHDWKGNPEVDRQYAALHGLEITSYHLPPITENIDESLADALAAARYASRLGANVALYKAKNRKWFAEAGTRLLDAIEQENLGLTLVLQNHAGSAISTLDDFRGVYADLHNDQRLKAILEVGHFQRIGVPWQNGWELLDGRIALIHVNEIREGKSVAYGSGEVDFPGLMKQIKTSGYGGDIVVELELDTNKTNTEETLRGLAAAKALLTSLYTQA